MPKLIKDGRVVTDAFAPAEDSGRVSAGPILSLADWQKLSDKTGTAVRLEPGEGVAALLESLDEIALIVINFPVFTDGRGFSYGRELRERGYKGELRASGHFIRDQLCYLHRVGFNAFQLDDESLLEESLESLSEFSEYYQASINQPLPLFRRRN